MTGTQEDQVARIAAALRTFPVPATFEEWQASVDRSYESDAQHLYDLGVRVAGKCGCSCICHSTEDDPTWPGPCAGCCEPGDNCECGRELARLPDSRVDIAEPGLDAAWAEAEAEVTRLGAWITVTSWDERPGIYTVEAVRWRDPDPATSLARVWRQPLIPALREIASRLRAENQS